MYQTSSQCSLLEIFLAKSKAESVVPASANVAVTTYIQIVSCIVACRHTRQYFKPLPNTAYQQRLPSISARSPRSPLTAPSIKSTVYWGLRQELVSYSLIRHYGNKRLIYWDLSATINVKDKKLNL